MESNTSDITVQITCGHIKQNQGRKAQGKISSVALIHCYSDDRYGVHMQQGSWQRLRMMVDTRLAAEENLKIQNTGFQIIGIKRLGLIYSWYVKSPSNMVSCLICIYFEDLSISIKDFNVIEIMVDFSIFNILCDLSSTAFFFFFFFLILVKFYEFSA